MAVALGLIATAIQWKYPEYKSLANGMLVLAGLIIFTAIIAAIVRSLTIKEYERKHPSLAAARPSQQLSQAGIDFKPHIEVNPVFSQTQSQERKQEQSVPEKKSVPPELECTDCYFVQGILSPGNLLFGDSGTRCMIAQADFRLKTITDSDPWLELRTQLAFYDQSGTNRLKRVSDGVWRETVNYIQMPLNTGDTRKLVIAIDLGEGFNSYQYAERHLGRRRFNAEGVFTHVLAPEMALLNGNDLTVQVLLSGKYLDEVTLEDKEVWFSLSRPEMIIKQIESPRGKEIDI